MKLLSLLIVAIAVMVVLADSVFAQTTVAPPADLPTSYSFGTLGAQVLAWIAAAFSLPIGTVLTVWITRLMKKAGVEVTTQMSDQLNKTLVNGLNDGAQKAGVLLDGQATIQIKNQIVASAVAYAQEHRADTIQALGLDPQSGAAVAALKARIATLVTDPSVPTPPALAAPAKSS